MNMGSSLLPSKVSMELHVKNREKLLTSLRQHLSKSSHSPSRWRRANALRHRSLGVLQDVASGNSILFAPWLPSEYAVWLGDIKPLSYFKEHYMVSTYCFSDEIASILQQHYQGSGKPLLFLLHGLNTDSDNYSKPAEFQGIDKFDKDLKIFHPILTECHVIKSELEIALIQYASDISSEAHVERVTAAGCYNMSKCSREIREIEAVMAGAPWPAKKTSTHVGNGLQI